MVVFRELSQPGRLVFYATGQHSQGTSPPKGPLSYPTHNAPTGHHNATQPEGYANQQSKFHTSHVRTKSLGFSGWPGWPEFGPASR